MSIPYNLNIPFATHNPSTDQPDMQTNTNSIASYVAIDHVPFNTSGSGQHEQVTFNANNVPSLPASPPVLFTNTVAGLPQLFFYSGSSAASSSQYVANIPGSTFMLGGVIAKWGNTGAVSDNTTITYPVAFPNNTFVVYLTIVDPNATSKTINVTTNSLTKTGFSVRVSSGSISAYYLAIGD